jgi:hypothetical protein
VLSLETDVNLSRPVGSQWESIQFIKNVVLKLEVLAINGANNVLPKL